MEGLNDLSGALFAFTGKLLHAANGKQYFFTHQNVDWVAVRPFVDDEALN